MFGARSLYDKMETRPIYDPKMPPVTLPSNVERIDTPREIKEMIVDLLGKLLVYKPEERITAAEALEHPWLNPA